jgi:hypothetical protein
MRLLALAVAFVFVLAPAVSPSASEAKKKPKDQASRPGMPEGTSPSAIAARQRHKETFDETQYYERLSEQIPFGSAAWWRQKQLEQTNE